MHKTASSSQSVKYKKALAFAKRAHQGQKRTSGEPYYTHPLAVANILKTIHADEDTLVAALLHDAVEDTEITNDEIKKAFGPIVAKLVEGVTKVEKLENQMDKQERNMHSIRKLFRTMGKDIRVIFIKLADRLHNMQTIGAVSLEKKQRIARETQDIYCPIADLLGIRVWYEELSDMCFQALEPEKYDLMIHKRDAMLKAQGKQLKLWAASLKKFLNTTPFKTADIALVPRHMAGVYEWARGEEDMLNHIETFFHVQITISDKLDCYSCMGHIHQFTPPIPHFIDDYIASPKVNGYRALHTTGISMAGNPIKIVVQNQSMHQQSLRGFAMIYEQKKISEHALRLPEWVENLTSLEKDERDLYAFFSVLQTEIFGERCRVYVRGQKKKYFDVPAHSSMLDLAYYVSPKTAAHLNGGTINKKYATNKDIVKDGDVVEFTTDASVQRNAWELRYLRSSLAQKHMITSLSTLPEAEKRRMGMDMMMQTIHITMDPFFGIKWQDSIRKRLDADDDVIADIGAGIVNPFLFLEEHSVPEDFFLLDPLCFHAEAHLNKVRYVLQTTIDELRNGDIIGVQVGPDVVDVMSKKMLDAKKRYNKEFIALELNEGLSAYPLYFGLRFTCVPGADPLEGIASLQSLLDTPVTLLQFATTSVTLGFHTDRLRTVQMAYEHLCTLPYIEQILRITPS